MWICLCINVFSFNFIESIFDDLPQTTSSGNKDKSDGESNKHVAEKRKSPDEPAETPTPKKLASGEDGFCYCRCCEVMKIGPATLKCRGGQQYTLVGLRTRGNIPDKFAEARK